ncbi:MAG: cation-translocating P-type ATPase [Firmicutes bacterium]|nr:cation-translocating P-type ATPase [[Eubacterium] siraeum]MCM1487935.1 cation-translocating P-type ATPase [Bacillota bacterium]
MAEVSRIRGSVRMKSVPESALTNTDKIAEGNSSQGNLGKGLGLSSAEAEKRLKENGVNSLEVKKKKVGLKMFMGQFKDVMVMILLAATVVSAVMGEVYDALTIMVIVVINAVMGFVQEYRTEKTLESIKAIAAPTAKALRDGRKITLPAEKLVIGDVIFLEAGDKIPADCRILEAMALECDESALTGESLPVRKTACPVNIGELNQQGAVYMGTAVTKGHCTAEVFATAKNTQMGMVSRMLSEIEEEKTPLQKRLAELGRIIGIGCLIVCIVVSAAGILRGNEAFDMLFVGITLAVAAIPEGLPATVTIALALAVRRIYKQKALVNKLHSVETLGCANVICTDKTGTLTANKMTVTEIYACGKRTRTIKAADAAAKMLFTCGALCNNSDGENGDPTEAALINSAKKAGVNVNGYVRTSEIPFDSQTRFMAVTVRSAMGESVSFLKGSTDTVLEKCGSVLAENGSIPLTATEKRKIISAMEEMSGKALRTLAFAYKRDSEDKYTFLGLQGMEDPLRPEIKDAIKTCERAGIRVIMLTGDHINTAVEIAKQAGIMKKGGRAYTGGELSVMSDGELSSALKNAAVFARVSPAHKLRIVKALKKENNIVAMTGDGVNDAPAVKEAAIGVAMGKTGSDVTKEAAKLVLLDDNFATLVNAVEQGRTVYSNIRKFIRYMLACNIGEVFTMLFAMIMGLPVVLVPIQLLLINLVTDGLPAIALGMEPAQEDIMLIPPRRGDESVFAGGMLFKIVVRGLLIGISSIFSFLFAYKNAGLEAGRTAAMVTLSLSQLIFVFECKNERRGIFNAEYMKNPKLILAVLISLAVTLAAVYIPVFSAIFDTVSLNPQILITSLSAAAAVPVIRSIWALGAYRDSENRKRALNFSEK